MYVVIVSVLFIIIIHNSTSSHILTCYYDYNGMSVDRIDAHLCTHLLLIGSTSIQSNDHIQFPPIEQINQLHRLQLSNPQLKLLITLTPDNQRMSRIVSEWHFLFHHIRLSGSRFKSNFSNYRYDCKIFDRQSTRWIRYWYNIYSRSIIIFVQIGNFRCGVEMRRWLIVKVWRDCYRFLTLFHMLHLEHLATQTKFRQK